MKKNTQSKIKSTSNRRNLIFSTKKNMFKKRNASGTEKHKSKKNIIRKKSNKRFLLKGGK